MSDKNDGQSLREVGDRRKQTRKRKKAIFAAVILLLIVIGAAYFITVYNRKYDSYEVMKTTEVTGTNAVGYLSYGSSVVKYSKDGAVAVDKDGSQLWNGSYEMADPIADTCGKYVVVADRNGKSVHVFDHDGEVGSYHSAYNIIKVEIADQGTVAALMENEDENYIKLYDTDGSELATKKTTSDQSGFPLDITLSDDGQKLVASYLAYDAGNLTNSIVFYNFGEVGENYTEGLVGGYTIASGTLAPRVEFVNNDTVAIFKDNGIDLYSMAELPKEIKQLDLEGKMDSILYSSSYIGVVLQKDGATSRNLVLYDLNGKKVLDKSIDYNYENIYLSDGEIIMNDNISCTVMKLNGRIKFKHTFDNNIEAIYPINHLDRYYLANDNQVLEIQLKE